MRRLPLILLLAATCALFDAGGARAQGLSRVQAAPPLHVCTADYFRFCRGVPPGRGRIVLCLNAYANELSQPCFQALALRGLASANALRICRADYERLCAQSAPGPSRGLACLLDNSRSLSSPCLDALSKQGLFDEEPDFRR